jgi:ribosomal protein S18 acetylase RimI-like enzyme
LIEYKEIKIEEGIDKVQNIMRSSFENPYSKEKVLEKLEGKKYWLYVAVDGRKTIGFKLWYEDADKQIYSWLGAVMPEYRRKGIAKKLMGIQLEVSKLSGYKLIKVKTHKGHPEMMKFLNKEGFKEVKREPNHWGQGKEAIFYEKKI